MPARRKTNNTGAWSVKTVVRHRKMYDFKKLRTSNSEEDEKCSKGLKYNRGKAKPGIL